MTVSVLFLIKTTGSLAMSSVFDTTLDNRSKNGCFVERLDPLINAQ